MEGASSKYVHMAGIGAAALAAAAAGLAYATQSSSARDGAADASLRMPAHANDDKWTETLERVLPAIVVIKGNYVRPYDGDLAGSASATGFVVDAQRGLILTNRHVVSTGPIRAEATFMNKEEVDLISVYRDPVHDFGFFRFDPSAIKFMKVTEISLCPEAAHVGTEIRVVGNDAGEKLSILAGVIARLDRNAPFYASDSYNDMNTFYLSAASNTSGGSSGSPVLNARGEAIALNAGGSEKAASSFYLPLDRVVRALELLQAGKPVPRGTERVVWRHETYDELKKLGLSEDIERRMRQHPNKEHPQRSGLLVLDQLVPGAPAEGSLDVGDILIKVNGKECTTFVDLEEHLDQAVVQGHEVEYTVERGGQLHHVRIAIEDLHGITPSTFLEAGGAVLHPISYMQARNGNLRLDSGVYVAFAGFVLDAAGVFQHTVITRVGNRRTPSLEAAEEAFRSLPDGETTTVRFFNIGDQHNEQVAMVRMNHRWFPMQFWRRNDETGAWDRRFCPAPPPCPVPKPSPVKFLLNRSEAANSIIPSLCKVSFNVLHAVDGVHDRHFVGSGLVVDASQGLVVVDRNTVVTSLGEVNVTFAASVEAPARIIYLHPIHNFAVIQYDVRRFEKGLIQSAPLCPEPLSVGEDLEFVGLCRTNTDTCVSQMVHVSDISCINIPQANVPRFRAMNEEIAKFDEIVNKSLGGVVIDSSGRVRSMWACYSFYSWGDEKNHESFHAMGVDIVCDVINSMLNPVDMSFQSEYPLPVPIPDDRLGGHAGSKPDETRMREWLSRCWPKHRSLDLGLKRFALSTARTNMRLPSEWVEKLQACHPGRSQVLSVSQRVHGTESGKLVNEGDLLLAVDGVPVCTFRDVEANVGEKESVELTLLRSDEVQKVVVPTNPIDGIGTHRVLIWGGLFLQEPYRPVLEVGASSSQVYCSFYQYGSPAYFYGLKAGRYITAVNDTPVSTLSDIKKVIRSIHHAESVKLKTIDLQGQATSYTMKMDYLFWPTCELHRDPEGKVDWNLTEI